MATGGHRPKPGASEPRQRSSWQRTTSMSDKEDNISLSSMPNELRPNNWDFSDWRPTTHKDQTKSRKKGNPEWEREQSHAQESPPTSERRYGTPRTFPRTKVSSNTPKSQRSALENLRQRMTFSDQEEGLDGERNNDRNLLKRTDNFSRQDSSNTNDSLYPRQMANRREDRNNRNNNKQNHGSVNMDEKPDSSQIVGRLMQIRDYIKQAHSMMESLRKTGDPPGYKDEMDRLQKLMDHLRDQEKGYTGLLQTILSGREENGMNDMSREMTPNLDTMDDTTSVDLDVQSEVSERDERSASASSRPRIEDKLGIQSENDEEDGAPSETSDTSSNMDDTVISRKKNAEWDYELGEEELATGGVSNPKEAAETLVALRQQQELLTKLIEQQEQMKALRGRQAALLALQQDAEAKLATAKQKSNEARNAAGSLEEAAMSMTNRAEALMNAESNAGRQPDSDLMDLKRQLLYMRNELKSQNPTQPQANTTDRQTEPRKKNNPPPRPPSPKLGGPQQSRMTNPAPVPTDASDMTRDQLHARLQELLGKRDRLDRMLEEEFSAPLLPAVPEQMGRDELQNKLVELQNKKRRMDDMLQELQTLRSNPALHLNNALVTGPPQPVSRQTDTDMDQAYNAAVGSENLANSVTDMLDARQKLQRLNEVKDRLSQLKSLVQFYQSSDGPGAGQFSDGQMDDEDKSSIPAYSDHGEYETTQNRRMTRKSLVQFYQSSDGPGAGQFSDGQMDDEDKSSIPAYSDHGEYETTQTRSSQNQFSHMGVGTQDTTKPKVNIPVHPQTQQESDENNSSSSSDTESQLSSLGPWGDDPEIQEKVRKLKTAKEKLRHLQNLVALAQHSPEVAGELPENLAEIAASIEDMDSQITQTDDRNNASTSEGEVPPQEMRDSYYQEKMQEQLDELEQLKDEKTRLLNIQAQLQTLHDRFQQDETLRPEDREAMKETQPKSRTTPNNQRSDSSNQQSTGPSVTFSSNEEVYDKMRKQRMLREELRDKKKQLESIMKKDRNRKQYYKNQDNQSDTVSYSTEAFGASASVDATMATWGGSTVDNLESITEDGPQDNEDEDDAYPIDGILQVEEEEEENNSDNETYTIEEDVRQRRKARAMAKGSGEGRKGKQSFPRPSRQTGARPKESWTRPTDFSKWTRTNRKSKQENYRSAEQIVQDDEDDDDQNNTVEELQKKLEQTAILCQSLLGDQAAGQLARQSASGFGSHSQLMPDLQQQLQQQQLMMSLNQCYQQISLQQLEMQNMQRQMQSLVYQFTDNSELNDSAMSDLRVRSMSAPFSPILSRPSPGLLPPDQFSFNPVLSPGNNRLLRRAPSGEIPNPYIRTEVGESAERQRNSSGRMGRAAKSEGYATKSKRKSVSPQQESRSAGKQKTTSVQTYEDETIPSEDPLSSFKFEQYLARKKRAFTDRVKVEKQEPGQDPGSLYSSQQDDDSPYRPGLSAGISGAGYQEDGRSVASSVQSSLPVQQPTTQAKDTRDTDDPNELSLFETLRETIYSEVATLISQNENRPHYLIELFRELQLLTNDYLKQRVLYDIKDVISKYLEEENVAATVRPAWLNPTIGNITASELTPSESLVTSDDDEVKSFLQNKVKQRVAANLVAKERQKMSQLLRSGSLNNDKYDYQEVAEATSSVSTPSNSLWESPFNRDSLGETAINLDKTLQRMREYEKKLAEKDARVKEATENRTTGAESRDPCSSSAMDQGSESSITSDTVPYPRIDTQQLDQQIKAIMTEVIPVLKEHMDNICSPQLLAYIKRLVLSLTRQYDSGEEFARFFHRQLGSILQDSLAKYEGRKMRECGGDLLVDMSEVLFNELAFFRLMKDLDDPLIAEKMQKTQVWSDFEQDLQESDVESDTTESLTANASDNQDKDETRATQTEEEDLGYSQDSKESDVESDTTESLTANASDNQDKDETRATQTEEEDLGKARDDAMANEVEVCDADDKDEDPESPIKGVQIELAPSETKPYTRIGSDEDDESADDESQSNEDPSETAVSINARRVNNTEELEEDISRQDGTSDTQTDRQSDDKVKPVSAPVMDQARDADQGASNGKLDHEEEEGAYMNGDILNGDIEVITMDDLPPSLTVMSQEDLQQKVSQEQQNNALDAMLNPMEGDTELAGDPQYLKEPDNSTQ